ncbi:MAG: nitroreductase family deazaflavin-dependent oxidoreductase [Acidimicrobiia bacterium]
MKLKPAGLMRWALNVPTLLYRSRLGFLMGKRFFMIEHRGRKTGTFYRTVLEVAGRYPDRDEWIVTAGWGPGSDWYRNLKAGTLEAVWTGSKRFAARVRFLEPQEAGQVMGDYERAHRRTAKVLLKGMGVSHDGTDEGRVEMMKQIPMVALQVRLDPV